MNIDNESLPETDDVRNDGPTEQELLDAVMANSQMIGDDDIPLPEEEDLEVDPAESEEELEDEETAEEEVVSEDDEDEEVTEDEEAEEEDDEDLPETSAYELDELDDFSIKVKIDGEETEVPIADLVKGYSTEQSLSKKGRELGDARKELEAEREQMLAEVQHLGEASAAMISQAEQGFAKQYHELEAQIEKARADGDTYEVNELKDKREQVQQKYWSARRQREGLMGAVAEQRQKVEAEQWQKQLEHFNEHIEEFVPGFDEKMAQDIRTFAIDEGVPEELLDGVTSPAVVKFVHDYMQLKTGVSKGAAKRKKAPTKKAVPAKKPTPAKKKAEDKAKMVKARAMREDASDDDQMDFLRQMANRTLGNL